MSSFEPLDDNLRALFEEERASHSKDPARAATALRRLETVVALTAGVGAAAVGTSVAGGAAAARGFARLVTMKKAALAVAMAFALGVGTGELHQRLARPRPSDSEGAKRSTRTAAEPTGNPAASVAAPFRDASPATPPEEPAPSAGATPTAPSSAAVVRPAGAATTATASSTGTTATSDLVREQALIDTARAALARGRGADALVAANEHATRFPHGRLEEEREFLAIQALVMDGQRMSAKRRDARFRTSHPNSLFLPALDTVLGEKEAGP